jgi:hypothetical protein
MGITRRIASSVAGSIITVLLAVGFFASCFLMVLHVKRDAELSYALIGELLLVAVLSLEGIVAVNHLRQSKLDSLHILFEVLHDYRSAEMMLSIVTLWRFRIEHGDKFVQVYLERWRQDNEDIAKRPGETQVEAMRATLHYRRRVLKEFYNTLAGLYELKVLPKEVIYTYWTSAELKIIPEILIPLEMVVAKELRMEHELGDWFRRLRRLYEDHPGTTCPDLGPAR